MNIFSKTFVQKVWLVACFLGTSVAVAFHNGNFSDMLNFSPMKSTDTFTLRKANDTGREYGINGPLTQLFNIKVMNQGVRAPRSLSILRRRWTAADARVGTKWTEFHTVKQGLQWKSWQPASCVHQNHGRAPVIVPLSRSVKYQGTWQSGFDTDFGMISSREIGYETTKKHDLAETAWYAVSPKGYGQVWAQQLVIWQDQQKRICKFNHYGKGGIVCSSWSVPVRGNLPVSSGLRFEWRTDWKMMDFKDCGNEDKTKV